MLCIPDPIAPHAATPYGWREWIGVCKIAMRFSLQWLARRVRRRVAVLPEPGLAGLAVQTPASYEIFMTEKLAELSGTKIEPVKTRGEALDALGRSINIMTRAALRKPNLKNYKANRSLLKRSRGIAGFVGWHERDPFFLVGAGPSLSKNVGELKRAVANGWPILAVDAALPMLADAGIEPDLAMVIDSKACQGKFFEKVDARTKTVLLAVACTHPDAIASWPGSEIRFFNSWGDTGGELYQLWYGRDFGSLTIGGNVSTGMLTFASTFCGAQTIVFVGQDFSYSSIDNYYSKGGVDELRPTSKPRQPTWDINGDTVHTDLSLFGYKHWSEMWMQEIKRSGSQFGYNPRFVNATEGGILGTLDRPYDLIPGLEQMRLSEIIDELETGAQAVAPASNTPDVGAERTLVPVLA